jgi:predicted Holliday junction resolvase-like endonuclease
MRRLFAIFVLIFLTSNTVLSQSQSIKFDTSNLKKQATEMAESFMLSDYKTLVKYTYPKVVQMMGGEQKMLNSINEGLTEMKEQGYIIKSVQVGLTDQCIEPLFPGQFRCLKLVGL